MFIVSPPLFDIFQNSDVYGVPPLFDSLAQKHPYFSTFLIRCKAATDHHFGQGGGGVCWGPPPPAVDGPPPPAVDLQIAAVTLHY